MVCVTQRPNGARSAWRDRRSSWPLGASLLVVLVFGWLLAGTTMASAFGHVYDAPTVARVEVDTASLGRGAEAVRNAPHPYDARVPRGAPPSDAVGTPAPHQVSDAVAAAGGQRSEWLGTSTTPLAFVTATEAASPGLSGVNRVGSALKTDAQHAFPDVVDNFATEGSKFSIPTKGPGGVVVRNSDLFQVEGSLNGRSGVFEWIVDQSEMTHRRFIPGGKLTGYPNQVPTP